MGDIAIRVDGLGKLYSIGDTQKRYTTLRDTITSTLTAPLARTRRLLRGEASGASNLTKTIWALRDVTFEIRQGEVVGIIGHNGAGKSTLLKILSRISEPTVGTADLYGRVGSLLEVGTGFHPELTGRENIYLNGAILGMSRIEIDTRFDEIVAFAEVEEFIDTPVKHYSSGMGLRLGFAVAAHLEPEILVVDEVLAVGDAAFQRKCLGKMSDVAHEGRTVLFVSHNMAAIENLCTRAIWLKHGRFISDGPTSEVIEQYLEDTAPPSSTNLADIKRSKPQYQAIIQSLHVLDQNREPATVIRSGDPITFEISYRSGELTRNLMFAVLVHTLVGGPLVVFHTLMHHGPIEEWPSEGVVRCNVPSLPLLPGNYRLTLECASGLSSSNVVDAVENAAEFTVIASDYYGTGHLPKPGRHGHFLTKAEWELPQLEMASLGKNGHENGHELNRGSV